MKESKRTERYVQELQRLRQTPEEDRLLTIGEAAARLQTSEDWLYHHWRELPFAVKVSPKQLRFSSQGIDEYIKERKNGATVHT